MQKMMARKVWSIRIINFILSISFILWVVGIKYEYDFIQYTNFIQDNMFNQSMYEFDMLDLDQYYNLDEDDQNKDEDMSEDYVSYEIT